MKPTISVVIPSYNNADYLGDALDSVGRQVLPANEIIVIDDGSTDETAVVASAFDVIYLRQENAGAAAARNRGVAAAQGEFIVFLDADDLWLPEKLTLQTNAFVEEPQLDMVFGHVVYFISPELSLAQREEIYCPPDPVPGYLPSAMMVRRCSWDRVGELETQWQVGEFIHWYFLAQEQGLTSHMLPNVVTRRRIHRTNQGIVKREARSDYLQILKARLDRKRRQR